ncbi:hypothetical protein J6590_033941 [Homalodisca vitripennis]|nr:hypothetical protein J6590_033941 [Homalodisca vitripennis]
MVKLQGPLGGHQSSCCCDNFAYTEEIQLFFRLLSSLCTCLQVDIDFFHHHQSCACKAAASAPVCAPGLDYWNNRKLTDESGRAREEASPSQINRTGTLGLQRSVLSVRPEHAIPLSGIGNCLSESQHRTRTVFNVPDELIALCILEESPYCSNSHDLILADHGPQN